jgi:hypothetical protein
MGRGIPRARIAVAGDDRMGEAFKWCGLIAVG